MIIRYCQIYKCMSLLTDTVNLFKFHVLYIEVIATYKYMFICIQST